MTKTISSDYLQNKKHEKQLEWPKRTTDTSTLIQPMETQGPQTQKILGPSSNTNGLKVTNS
jgi:hypothetical protein